MQQVVHNGGSELCCSWERRTGCAAAAGDVAAASVAPAGATPMPDMSDRSSSRGLEGLGYPFVSGALSAGPGGRPSIQKGKKRRGWPESRV